MNPADTLPTLTRGQGSQVYSTDGRCWTDLVMGFGACFLGHAHPAITTALQTQATALWACGRLPVERQEKVDALLQKILPFNMSSLGLLSTGMEATEYAMRIAATQTGRNEFVAFGQSMHGKSAMSAALCWPNAPLRPSGLHTLPFVDVCAESDILERLRQVLQTGRIGALFVEPIQGSNGAHQASRAFYEEAIALCHEHGSLCVFDEILTGLYRTGPAFFCENLSHPVDLLVFAKSMGNGFPVSCVAGSPAMTVSPRSLPGSTFAGNPLALAVVEATLRTMTQQPVTEHVLLLQTIVHQELSELADHGVTLRGQGALWCLEAAPPLDMQKVAGAIKEAGLLITTTGRFMRLLPAATMPAAHWRSACQKIAQVLRHRNNET